LYIERSTYFVDYLVRKTLLVLSSLLILASCSSQFASNGEHLYLQSKNTRDPVVNPPLTPVNISHFYDLPQPTQNPIVSIAPPVIT